MMAAPPPAAGLGGPPNVALALAVGERASCPPPPPLPRRPLLAPPPPILVKPLILPTWPTTTTPLVVHHSQVRPLPSSSPPFASLGLMAPSPPDLALAVTACGWGLLAALRRLRARGQVDGRDDSDLPDLATRVAGALEGGAAPRGGCDEQPGSGGTDESEASSSFLAAPAFDASTLAAYRRFTRGAKLGRVREWAAIEG